jgi:hypothetical protein
MRTTDGNEGCSKEVRGIPVMPLMRRYARIARDFQGWQSTIAQKTQDDVLKRRSLL